ncbi:MAG: FkbM family methyltransferase [Thioalkalispiraceae bacterium]|jgi:FkbM family methyltransferase
MNRTLRKLKRELVAGLSKIYLKKVKSDYFGMPLTVPVVYGVKNGGYIVPAETWMGDCLNAFVSTKPGTVIDIGVNVGLYLVKLRLISKDVPYIGFEPNPSCLLYTQELIRLNHFQHAKVIPIALAEHEDLTRFYASKIGDETGSLVAEHHQGKSMAYSFDVLVMKGDDLLPRFELDAISVIKIDVEEAEIYVLRGLVETLKKYRPYVYSEILDVGNDANRIQRKNEMCELFKDLDYRIFGIDKTSMALSLISDYDKVGIDYQQEYIFCPAENVPAFLENIKNNTSNIKVN